VAGGDPFDEIHPVLVCIAWRQRTKLPMTYWYPLNTAASLAERVSELPPGERARRWVLRDDNMQHYHGIISLAEDPVHLELYWKANPRSREQLVGLYRLHLARLLAEGYVRRESEDRPDDVRLRFHRGERGVIHIQTRDGAPALAVGVVDAILG